MTRLYGDIWENEAALVIVTSAALFPYIQSKLLSA
jgi:hypothetical protein